MLTSSILLLNNKSFATSTLTLLFCYNRVTICCYRLVIRVRSCSFLVDRAYDAGAMNCPIGCYCCWWDIYSSDGSGDNDDSS